MADEQDRAEALDADKIDGEYPPDDPLGVDGWGVTGDEQAQRESLAERFGREEPVQPDAERPVIQPYAESEEDLLDDEAQLVADAEIDARDPEADGMPEPAEEAALRLRGVSAERRA